MYTDIYIYIHIYIHVSTRARDSMQLGAEAENERRPHHRRCVRVTNVLKRIHSLRNSLCKMITGLFFDLSPVGGRAAKCKIITKFSKKSFATQFTVYTEYKIGF